MALTYWALHRLVNADDLEIVLTKSHGNSTVPQTLLNALASYSDFIQLPPHLGYGEISPQLLSTLIVRFLEDNSEEDLPGVRQSQRSATNRKQIRSRRGSKKSNNSYKASWR